MRDTQPVVGEILPTEEIEENLNLERMRPPLNMVRFLLGLEPLALLHDEGCAL